MLNEARRLVSCQNINAAAYVTAVSREKVRERFIGKRANGFLSSGLAPAGYGGSTGHAQHD